MGPVAAFFSWRSKTRCVTPAAAGEQEGFRLIFTSRRGNCLTPGSRHLRPLVNCFLKVFVPFSRRSFGNFHRKSTGRSTRRERIVSGRVPSCGASEQFRRWTRRTAYDLSNSGKQCAAIYTPAIVQRHGGTCFCRRVARGSKPVPSQSRESISRPTLFMIVVAQMMIPRGRNRLRPTKGANG